MRLLSKDMERMVTDEPALAIAAYERVISKGNEWIGKHIGIFDKAEDAESWIESGEPKPQRIHIERK